MPDMVTFQPILLSKLSSGTKISIMFEKRWEMRLWIRQAPLYLNFKWMKIKVRNIGHVIIQGGHRKKKNYSLLIDSQFIYRAYFNLLLISNLAASLSIHQSTVDSGQFINTLLISGTLSIHKSTSDIMCHVLHQYTNLLQTMRYFINTPVYC